MKSDSNTEMDLLLRRHARRERTAAPGAGDAAATSAETTGSAPHMDADAMNAYAEGKLPLLVRARYVAHLADCDHCRAVVTNLTLAANVTVEDRERDVQAAIAPKRSWREWLAALFAPPVMRYGAAAIVLLCAVGVVFLALRQQKARQQQAEPTYVAQNNQREGQSASAVKPEASQPTAAGAPPVAPGVVSPPAPLKDNEVSQTRAPADTVAEEKAKQANVSQPPGTPKTVAPAAAPLPSIEATPQQTLNDQRDEDLAATTTTAEPPPAPMSPAASGAREQQPKEVDRASRNRKDDATSDDRTGRTFGATSNTANREAEETAALSKPAKSTVARQRSARRPETRTEGADTNASGGAGERPTETRSVGGRQFRRQGNAWVDTAYVAGRATVNVIRGSEQYRALVADEPGLRTIADQLGGEVIVVWKSRAYRIH